MKIIGITGSFGSGKTRITRLFFQHNCKIINLDEIGHEVLKSANIKRRLIKQFGNSIIENNKIIRSRLRALVFSNSDHLDKLNRISHPEIKKYIFKEIKKSKKKRYKAIVIDAALLLEMNLDKFVDIIVTVSTWKIIRFLRLLINKGVNFKEFNNISNSQFPHKIKVKSADYVIDNNLPFFLIQNKINRVIQIIL